MRKLASVLWVLTVLLVQPVAGQFEPQVLPTPPADGVEVDFLSVNRANTGSYVSGFGSYLGPYNGLVGGMPATLYCVDYGHQVDGNDIWTSYATALNGVEPMADTRLFRSEAAWIGGPASQLNNSVFTRYRNAAFLSSLFSVVDDSPANWTALHGMIWTLTSPEFGYAGYTMENYFGTGATGDRQRFAQYYQAWQAFDPTGWYVLTWESPVGGHDSPRQEFLVQSTVPEPETYLLLLSGLVVVFFFARRRLNENGYT